MTHGRARPFPLGPSYIGGWLVRSYRGAYGVGTSGGIHMRPQEAYQEAMRAIDAADYTKATAFATTGLLSLAIGAATAVEALGLATEHK